MKGRTSFKFGQRQSVSDMINAVINIFRNTKRQSWPCVIISFIAFNRVKWNEIQTKPKFLHDSRVFDRLTMRKFEKSFESNCSDLDDNSKSRTSVRINGTEPINSLVAGRPFRSLTCSVVISWLSILHNTLGFETVSLRWVTHACSGNRKVKRASTSTVLLTILTEDN
jgi:hypothetical protein